MRRDEAIDALRRQPADTDVQVCIGGYLLDVTVVDFAAARDAIVLHLRDDDLRDVLGEVLRAKRWWRSSTLNCADTESAELNPARSLGAQ